LLVEAEARLWRGDLALAEARGVEASQLFPPGSAGWFRGFHHAVVASGKLGHVDQVERTLAQVRSAVADEGAQSAQINCLAMCASELVLDGRYAAAEAAFADLKPRAPRDPLSLALIAQARSFLASARGDSLACLDGLRAALAGFEQVEDRRNACIAHGNLGFILAELGELEGAEDALRAALVTADRMGLHDAAAGARQNLGYVLGCRGRIEEARRLLRQSIGTFQRQRAPRPEGLTRVYLAQTELRAGDPSAAELEARAAADLLLAIPSAHAVAVAVLARALLGQGRPAEALEAAAAGYAELCALGSIEEGEALVRLVYAEALDAAGRTDDCAAALVDARVRLLVRASRISDPAWRERFLCNVLDNARTLELSRARLGR